MRHCRPTCQSFCSPRKLPSAQRRRSRWRVLHHVWCTFPRPVDGVTSIIMKDFLTRLRRALRLHRPEHHILVALDAASQHSPSDALFHAARFRYAYFLSRQGSPQLMPDVMRILGHGMFVTRDTQVGITGRTARRLAPRLCRRRCVAEVTATRWLAQAKCMCVPGTCWLRALSACHAISFHPAQ